ncbi:MAG: hypothetical protein COV32_00530 [Candidatus Yonathbacteria bacterium CG10_big_fil_rev_8_21_14_0_10_43_136]|nr:MAG: hypothetical protein COW60_02440 [Candidatus Yonathbacteria bacterium CG17_big_fil_post_rev_8_21_14_2_50_43_9]PIR40924.1 MAG: hypothetical protein COV32_00530 [Candidatus Yonathbacteria bacterium CG10_big_fil_rev_8_21_14_0_10_43_136]PIX57375.1 MAG: hypothetical protein COZ48_00790 [Candidatus Yonathbacteria bacterium CG_4_10_14_3_um_filter_43_12]PIY58284.1 MAG: hypothetical protein COY98_02590 [Candidatus Yonathbacteria bacterium CG_4_10_14_0_8_um_filter_43_17]
MKIAMLVLQVILLSLTIYGTTCFWKSASMKQAEGDPTMKIRVMIIDGFLTIIFGLFTIIAHLATSYF